MLARIHTTSYDFLDKYVARGLKPIEWLENHCEATIEVNTLEDILLLIRSLGDISLREDNGQYEIEIIDHYAD